MLLGLWQHQLLPSPGVRRSRPPHARRRR
jgi:hypothetical protein